MLVSSLLNFLLWLLGLLLTPIDIPDLPENVSTVIAWAMDHLMNGLSIFAAFTHFSYIMILFGIVVVIDAAMLIYKFVMWILRKIPMVSIE